MNTQSQFLFGKEPGFSLVALPYRREAAGPNLAMVVLLPDQKDGLHTLESQLTSEMIETALIGATSRRVDLTLPKFRLSNRIYARRFLQKMGMTEPFSKTANFSGITGRQELSIDAVIHQAYIDVDEEGTVATAATAAVMGLKSAPIGPETAFNADHPFLYVILDMETKQFLFIGRVVNPVGE
jgi:leukocyte elastase inhibitor